MKKVILLAVVAGMVSVTSCKKATDAVADTAGAVAEGAGDVVDGAANVAGDAVDAAGDVAEGAVDAAGNAVDAAGNAVEGAVDSVTGAIPDAPKFESADLQTWATSLKDNAVKAKDAALKGDLEGAKAAAGEIAKLAEGLAAFKDNPQFAQAEEYYNKIKGLLE